MIKIHSIRASHRWLYLAAAGLCLAVMGHFSLGQGDNTVGTVETQTVVSSSRFDPRGAMDAASVATADSVAQDHPGEDGREDDSTALETGMEDWQKPENVALRAELQRWHDHREETSMEQRRADASALMAQVEARQAAGKISQTSAALAKLMLLQGAPSDDPQHAARLQEVMTHLAGQLAFGE
ncbi:MAG: hypothetical protein A3G29_08315 [Burkholderiales bacterium RIFCSPLOWO2_12_FULL_64_99]|nr:MAG: hypothetical protein A3E52_01665 [Burkholderiales bacterium RIFCSPHIGHO2_12_FULL_63_20]OGB62195.1 MAG: hypothetical protein A3G29_08315 [Burkholderiales bacterium RIFCSPLOWO2_12_FULL_64_99]